MELTTWQKKVIKAEQAFLRKLHGTAHAVQVGDTRLDGHTGAITLHDSGTIDVSRQDRQVVSCLVQSYPTATWHFDSLNVYVELSNKTLPNSPEVIRAIGKLMASLFGASRVNAVLVHIMGTQVMRKDGSTVNKRKGVSGTFDVFNDDGGVQMRSSAE